MKKHYVVATFHFSAIVASLLFLSVPLHAQNCPPSNTMPEFENFTYTSAVSWNTSAYQSLQYHKPSNVSPAAADYMRFRMMSPNGFDRCANDGKKYPLIVFLHGSGESAPFDATPNNGIGEQNNDLQLVHGGQRHRDAVLNNTFPGFVIFPQIRKSSTNQNYWGIDNLEAVRYIIDKLIADYKVDPERIYIHGLSMGGEGTWIFISRYPRYFAAAHPMSSAGSNFWNGSTANRDNYKYIPLRHAQGGLDNAPTYDQGNEQVLKIREVGGSIRYSYYPTLGHGTWNSEYAKADFFSWFLSHRKNEITVFDERTTFCPGENFSLALAMTPGFLNYEWVKDNTANSPFATGSGANQVIITQAVSVSSGEGTYYARYQRANGTWTDWSPGVVISRTQGPSATPTIATNGQSLNLPSLDGSPEVILYGTASKAGYEWSKDASILTTLTTSNITVNTAGSYTLKTKDPAGTGFESNGITPTEFRAAPRGCLSTGSAPVVITTQNGLGVPAPPTNFFASSTTPTSVTINWDDRSTNETGFELYRSMNASSGYELISIRPASTTSNPQVFVDNGLSANTTYFYRMRAVNTSGGSSYTPVAQVTTVGDNVPPTAPILTVGATSRTEINLSWAGSTDNVSVFEYDVYQNGTLINTTTTTSYKASNLIAFATYTYVVRARDVSNNVSPPSNQVSPAAVNTGLFYSYYHTAANLSSVDQITISGSLIKTGYVAQFLLDPRTRNDGFAFVYEGFINIPTTGSYTFFTSSDDGSKLYVNNTLVVNNDGTHGCSEKASSAINLSAGTYPIKALMFENGGGECLTVRWQGPGITKAEIPASALRDNYTAPAALTAPINFAATDVSFSQINLTWKDQSNNETGFEISTSLTSGGTYQVVTVTAAGAEAWSHSGLTPNTTYYYKIRAINATSASVLVGPVNDKTQNAPTSPNAPTSLVATSPSSTQVNLSWIDNSSTEAGFEIQKSSNSSAGFVTFATVGSNVTMHVDNVVNGHSTIYYRIRAIRTGATPSAYSNTASVSTPNSVLTLNNVPDQSIFAGTTATISLGALDADNDPINFTFTGLPPEATFQSNGYGNGILTFPATVAASVYNIQVQASDGIATVADSFVVTVGSNHSPIVTVTTPVAFTGSITTEEGRTAQLILSVSDADATNVIGDPRSTITSLPVFVDPVGWAWNASTRKGTLTFNFTPEIGEAGVKDISVTFSDGNGGIATFTFNVTVLPIDPFFTISLNLVNSTPDPTRNYNPVNYFENAPWNNISQNQTLTNLMDDQGNMVRFLTALPAAWADGHPRYVDLPSSPTAVYTEKVRESFLRKNSGSATLTFSNLNTKMSYKVTVFGSGPLSPAPASSTQYVLSNTSSELKVTLSNGNNTSSAKTTGFISAPTGTLTLTTKIDDAAGVTPGHMYLNSVILTGFYDTGTPPDAATELTLSSPIYNRVDIRWKDNSFNEDRFEILRAFAVNGPWTVIGQVNENDTAFVDNSVVGRTTYYYKIRAFNDALQSDSDTKLITTPNGLPVITSLPTVVLQSGQIYQQNITATDPEHDPLTLTALNLPLFATLVDNGDGTGYIRFIPQSSDIGSYTFIIQATDNFSGRSETGGSLVVQDAQYEEVVYLNFAGAGNAAFASAPWNNISNPTNTTSLVNSTGAPSPIDLYVGPGWISTGANSGGVSTGNNSGIYSDNILMSYWETTQTDGTDAGALITLSGLSAANRYNLEFLGSRNQFWFSNTIYTVTGTVATSKSTQTSKNASKTIKFSGIIPNAQGEITIRVKRGAPENASPLIEHLPAVVNALIIETAVPGNNPIKPGNLKAEVLSQSAIRLSWTDNASDETGYEIYRTSTQGGVFSLIHTTAANAETYTNVDLNANAPYIYRIRAIKNGGASAYTNEVYAVTYDQIIYVNVNAGGQMQAATPWNNLATSPASGLTFGPFTNDANQITSVGLQMINWENGGTNNTGYLTGSGVYPDAVLEGFYYYEQFDPAIQHKITGLAADRAYDLVFMGSEWSSIATIAGHVVATDYTVGTETVSQFNGKNTTETVAIKNITPDQTNAIEFQVKQNDEARYGVWNSLEIRSYTPLNTIFDQTPPTVPQNLAATDTTDVTVDLAWSPSTDNAGVAGYEIFQGSTLVSTVTTTSGQVTGLQPLTTYTFTVRAFDVKGNRSPFSNSIQITTLPSSTAAILYYPKATGSISTLSTWVRYPDGSGSSPTNFLSNNQHFVLTRNATLTASFSINGTNSKLIVDDNITLTVDAPLTANVDLEDNATIVLNTAAPTFGTLSPTSTVVFNTANSTVPGAIYGNVTFEGQSSTKTLQAGSYIINGDLTIGNGVAIDGAVGNSTIINLMGDLTFSGTASMNIEDQFIALSMNSGSTQSITANQTDINLYQLHLGKNTQVNINSSVVRNIHVGTLNDGGLVLDSGAVFNLASHHLNVEGEGAINAANNGTGRIRVLRGNISINADNQVSNLYFVNGADTLTDFHMNSTLGQVHVRSKMNVRGILDINNGTINSNGNITLVSDASGSAWIGPIKNSGSLNGNIEFQRYYTPNGRAYRYVSAPIIGSTVANWNTYLPVVGPFAGSSNSNTTNSLFYYDNEIGWVAYPSATSQEQIAIGRGYSIYMFNGATPRRLHLTGPIAQGDFVFPNLGTDLTPGTLENDVQPQNGWNLLGNPYAAPIQWGNDGWISTGLNGAVYVRHNEIVDGTLVSNVRVWNGVTGTLPKGVIAQGQSFWVKATGDESPTLTITEDAKYDTSRVILQRVSVPRNILTITLKKGKLSDETIIHFDEQSTDGVDQLHDAFKLANNYFNLSTKAGSNDLAINTIPYDFCSKTIKLNVANAVAGNYTFEFSQLESFTLNLNTKLIDHFTNQEVALLPGVTYAFSVTTDPASSGANRFEIQFAKPAIDEAVAITAFTNALCGDGSTPVTIIGSQPEVTYTISADNTVIKTVKGDGSNVSFDLATTKLQPGENTLQLKAAFDGCVEATLPATTIVTFTPKPAIVVNGAVLSSSAASGNQWYLEGNAIAGADQKTFEPQVSGEYTVKILGTGCEIFSDPVLFNVTDVEGGLVRRFEVYPNPVRNRFKVILDKSLSTGEIIDIQFINSLGQIVSKTYMTYTPNGVELNASHLGSGLYNLVIRAKNRQFEARIVKE